MSALVLCGLPAPEGKGFRGQIVEHIQQIPDQPTGIILGPKGCSVGLAASLELLSSRYPEVPLAFVYSEKEIAPLMALPADLTLTLIKAPLTTHDLDLFSHRCAAHIPQDLPTTLVAESPAMRSLLVQVAQVAKTEQSILLQGESGSGKEEIARLIHQESKRSGAFVPVNCGAIAEHLLESELFGHLEGSFTGAHKKKKGLLAEAGNGTIFLDEIAELSLPLQTKLLRVVETKKFRPVGSNEEISLTARIISATHRDLRHMVSQKLFREDLFYRLDGVMVQVPPLRERREDLVKLIRALSLRLAKKHQLLAPPIREEVVLAVRSYAWPGNVRELTNVIERALIFNRGPFLELEIPKPLAQAKQKQLPLENFSLKKHALALEKLLIRQALDETMGNRTHAAKLLELSHRALLYKMKEYGIG